MYEINILNEVVKCLGPYANCFNVSRHDYSILSIIKILYTYTEEDINKEIIFSSDETFLSTEELRKSFCEFCIQNTVLIK
jgi:hypothetical protein